jgi:hydroxymethylpyrimidine pyrophosphatase-like HAD family hydrolase
MEIEIIEKQNQSLVAYKDGELLFYSTIKQNWFSRIIKIYNPYDVLVLELKYDSFSYKILHQNKFMTKLICEINNNDILFNNDKRLYIKSFYFISINNNFNYFFKGRKIAQVKQKIISFSTKFLLTINDENLDFLDQIILHVLSIKTGFSID